MKIEITLRYDVTDPDGDIEQLGTEILEREVGEFLARLHRRFVEEGLDVERFESTKRETH